VEGDIMANGRVTVDAAARVGGSIQARAADVNGIVGGNIDVPKGKLTLRSSAIVKGGVTASQLVVSEGAFLQGKCTTTRELDGLTAEGDQDPFICLSPRPV
jgi:cytoskeletal protein CcmA (bactofilin family)